MSEFLQQVFTLLTTEAGSLTYHLVLAFAIAGAIPGAIHQTRTPGLRQGSRMVFGLGGLLLFQLVLFASTGLIWQGLFNPGDLLPIIDRGVILCSFILLIWLWAFPEPSRTGDAATGFLALIVIAFMILTGIWWFDQPISTPFAGSWVDSGSDYMALGLAGVGALILLIRKTPGWGLGLAMLSALGLGHLANLFLITPNSDYSGAIRLAQMASYPLLLALPVREPVVETKALALHSGPASSNTPQTAPDRRNITLDIKTMRALLHVSADGNLEAISSILAKVAAHSLVADVCLLVSPPDGAGMMNILGGYDLIRERNLPKISLGKGLTPTLGIALQNQQVLRLPASSGSADMVYLGHRLSVQKVGYLLSVPIKLSEGGSVGSIVLLSPYTMRSWSDEDQTRLTELADSTAAYLQQHEAFQLNQEQLKQLRDAFEVVKGEKDSILDERQALIERIQELRQSIGNEQSQTEDMSNLKEELRLALQEISYLNNLPGSSRSSAGKAPITKDDFAEILTVAEELRQPMSSLVGYTGVLLAESHGILGDRQRKIVERIRVANERMTRLLDELIGDLTTEESQFKGAELQNVDLSGAIQIAIDGTENLREAKKIGLRVKIPEGLPTLQANPVALQKVLDILIKNASQSSEPDTNVFLQAQVRSGEGEQGYVLLQISDTGSGISREEMPHVFSKLSGMDEPASDGGTNGTGLHSVKSLVESFGGRVLVDSEPGRGATFSLLLPILEA